MGVNAYICEICGAAEFRGYCCGGEVKYECDKFFCRYCFKHDVDVMYCKDCEILTKYSTKKKKEKPKKRDVEMQLKEQNDIISDLNIQLEQYDDLIKKRQEAEKKEYEYKKILENYKICCK